MEMETECRKWNAISVGECTSRSVEQKGVQSHAVECDRGLSEFQRLVLEKQIRVRLLEIKVSPNNCTPIK